MRLDKNIFTTRRALDRRHLKIPMNHPLMQVHILSKTNQQTNAKHTFKHN